MERLLQLRNITNLCFAKSFGPEPSIKTLKSIWVVILLAALASCTTTKAFHEGSSHPVRAEWEKLAMEDQCHTGIAVYDASEKEWLFGYRDDNYFTPASNTKILTLYAALHCLEDRVPAAYYARHQDTIVLWGGADPGAGYPDPEANPDLIHFLREEKGPILFSDGNSAFQVYGEGWAWDDYAEPFQCERTTFPLYGNLLHINRTADHIDVTPKYFAPLLDWRMDTFSMCGRSEFGETYTCVFNRYLEEEHFSVPIRFQKNDLRMLWQEATGKDIFTSHAPYEPKAKRIPGAVRDSLLKQMMWESDNFIAEQLLLAASQKELGTMNEQAVIDYLRHSELQGLSDYLQWVDGSGLSRYNQLTPRSLVEILQRILDQQGMDYVQKIFASGSDTPKLHRWFEEAPFMHHLFAKTGGLKNVVCLSGYLITKKNHVLIFSWLNNNVMEETQTFKNRMGRLLSYFYEEY